MDTDAGEPVGRVTRDPSVTVDGQISWKSDVTEMTIGGKVYKVDGYVVFRIVDLAAQSITPDQIGEGTKITRIGTGTGQHDDTFYVYRTDRRGHYPDQGGATLLKVWYGRRRPVRHN
jgi:hypothetical protein